MSWYLESDSTYEEDQDPADDEDTGGDAVIVNLLHAV